MNIIDLAYAAPAQQEPSALGFLLPIFILVLMYFILIRPQSKKLKEHKEMLSQFLFLETNFEMGWFLINQNLLSCKK